MSLNEYALNHDDEFQISADVFGCENFVVYDKPPFFKNCSRLRAKKIDIKPNQQRSVCRRSKRTAEQTALQSLIGIEFYSMILKVKQVGLLKLSQSSKMCTCQLQFASVRTV